MLKKLSGAMVLVLLMVTQLSYAKVVTKAVDYEIDGKPFKGLLAYDDSIKGKRPGVLVVHEWWGVNDYAHKRAKDLAKEGYVAFALDMYGSGKVADHPDQAKAFMNATLEKMPVAEKRFKKAKSILESQPNVDSDNIAAIGYCFGGGIVLHMARQGMDLEGVVSFHGSLGTQDPAEKGEVKARVRVFNGADDPFVTQEQIEAFKKEMEAANVDYKFVNYKGAVHSFTNPGADEKGKKFDMPLAYNEKAAKDSWQSMLDFFNDIFSE
ncbi:MAG: dienelactone hydrolase family protein [Ketobacteraceae bacterium]|nr:dienelactone hydrolase family protein [Ketobacteraceae bacterium]